MPSQRVVPPHPTDTASRHDDRYYTEAEADTALAGKVGDSPNPTSGSYFGPSSHGPGRGTTANITPVLNTHYATPFYVPNAMTIDRIGVNVATAVAATLARLGIYTMGADGLPGTLLLDAGTVDTATTGFKELTVSQALSKAWYFTVLAGNNGTVAFSAVNASRSPLGIVSNAATQDSVGAVTIVRADITLPTSFGTPTGRQLVYPSIIMRVV